MFNISPAPAALAKRASKALSSAKLMFSRCRPPLGLDLSALSPPRSYAICARFTVLSEAPIASAIAGCVIPPSRSSTIWMRWRRFGSPFQRSAVFNRRTWALVHLTISSPESDDQRESQAGSLAKGSNSRTPAQNVDSTSYGVGIRSELPVICVPSSYDEMIGCDRRLAVDDVGDPERQGRRAIELGAGRHGEEHPHLAGLIGSHGDQRNAQRPVLHPDGLHARRGNAVDFESDGARFVAVVEHVHGMGIADRAVGQAHEQRVAVVQGADVQRGPGQQCV